jgi:hypothetical protein
MISAMASVLTRHAFELGSAGVQLLDVPDNGANCIAQSQASIPNTTLLESRL